MESIDLLDESEVVAWNETEVVGSHIRAPEDPEVGVSLSDLGERHDHSASLNTHMPLIEPIKVSVALVDDRESWGGHLQQELVVHFNLVPKGRWQRQLVLHILSSSVEPRQPH